MAKDMKPADTSGGIDLKSGYRSSEIIMDGFKGQPAQINELGEYVCLDDEQYQFYMAAGKKCTRKKSEY
jgi:hypothetical protein